MVLSFHNASRSILDPSVHRRRLSLRGHPEVSLSGRAGRRAVCADWDSTAGHSRPLCWRRGNRVRQPVDPRAADPAEHDSLLGVITVAIGTTKIPMLVHQGFWAMAHEARTDFAMLCGLLFLLAAGPGPLSLDRYWSRS